MSYFLGTNFNLQGRSYLVVDVPGGGGAVRVNSQQAPSYPYIGTHVSQVPVRLTALPEPGYRFERWAGAVESSEPELLLDMTGTRQIVAHFIRDASEE